MTIRPACREDLICGASVTVGTQDGTSPGSRNPFMIFEKTLGRLDRDAVPMPAKVTWWESGTVLATSAADVGGEMASKEPLTGNARAGSAPRP